MTDSPTQAELRALMRMRRDKQPAERARADSVLAQRHLLASEVWKGAKSVALYAAARGETQTDELFREALASGKAVFFPRVCPGEKGRMDFVRVSSANDFAQGAYGLFEPLESLPGQGRDVFSCDLVVVPGVVFSLQGDRIGFGGGYYDRFFTDSIIPTRIGLCFSFQIVPLLPRCFWDVPVTHICSEQGLVEAAFSQLPRS